MENGGLAAPSRSRRMPAATGRSGRRPRADVDLACRTLILPRRCVSNFRNETIFCRQTVCPPSGVTRADTQSRTANADRTGSYAVESSGLIDSLSAVLRPGSHWLLVLSTAGSSQVETIAGGVRPGRLRREANDAATCCRRFLYNIDGIPTLSGRLRVVFRPLGLT